MDYRAKRQEILQRIVKTADHNTMTWLYAAVVTLDKDSLTEAFRRVGKLTPRQLMQVFPVVKEYDGDHWGTKDYFYTLEAMRKHGLDKRIGRTNKEIHHVLWDYMNHSISGLVVENRMSDPDLRLTTRQKTERWFQTQYYKLLTFNANLRAKQAERERPAPVYASLRRMLDYANMSQYEALVENRIDALMAEDETLGDHVCFSLDKNGTLLDVAGLEKTRSILAGYLGKETIDGTITYFHDRVALDESNHQLRLILARATSQCLRKIRDRKGLNDASISSETLESISKDAAEELRRRSIPMIVARLARYAYNTAKNGIIGWLFINRLKRHVVCENDA